MMTNLLTIVVLTTSFVN